MNFVKNDDIRILRDIEQYYSTQIDEMPMNGQCSEIEFYFLLNFKIFSFIQMSCVVLFGNFKVFFNILNYKLNGDYDVSISIFFFFQLLT